MIREISSDSFLSSLMPTYRVSDNCNWLSSIFNIAIPIDNNLLIFNSLSKCFIEAPESYANLFISGQTINTDLLTTKDYEYLVTNGFLIPEHIDETRTYLEINDLIRNIKEFESGFKRYNILTTTSCNIKCFYCFEGNIKPISMTTAIAKGVAKFIVETKVKDQDIHLRWFGGEPLVNYKVIDEISGILLDEKVPFFSTMSSNSILFTDSLIEKAHNRWNLKKVRTSFDGLEIEHNRRKGCNSLMNPFQSTINNIDKLLSANINVDIRFTLDLENSRELLQLATILCEKYAGNSQVKMYTRCIFQETTSEASAKCKDRVLETIHQKEEIDSFLRSKGMFDYNRLLPIGYQPYYCAANDPQAVVISPKGNLFSCETIDETSKFWGTINKKELNVDERNRWLKHGSISELCTSCKFLPSCTPFAKNMCKNDYYDCRARAENCYSIYLIHKYKEWSKKQLS